MAILDNKHMRHSISRIMIIFMLMAPFLNLPSQGHPDHDGRLPLPVMAGDWTSANGNLSARIFLGEDSTYRCLIVRDLFSLEPPLATLVGEERDQVLYLQGEGWKGEVREQNLLLEHGDEIIELNAFSRVSPSLNESPPQGAVILFNGTGLEAFGKLEPKQWLVPSGPADGWKVVPEGMEAVPGSGSIVTTRQFGDIFLHAEFRLLGAPTNGGIYLQSRYEVNIKDSFGQTEGAPCGALGNVLEPGIPVPTMNMASPPMCWQTFDIEFRAPRFDPSTGEKTENARITLLYNGVMIYDDVEIQKLKGAAGRLGEAPRGPLYLQEHGTAYQFRNIWIVEREAE